MVVERRIVMEWERGKDEEGRREGEEGMRREGKEGGGGG